METIEVHKSEGLKNEDFTVVVRGIEVADRLAKKAGLGVSEVELRVDGKKITRAECVAAWAGPVQLVPAMMLERHHDPACRTYAGLILTMACLAQKNILQNDEFSVILLRPLESKLELIPGSRLSKLG